MRRAPLVAPVAALLIGAAAPAPADWRVPYPEGTMVLPEDGYLYEAERIAPHVYLLRQPEPFHYQPLGNVTAIAQADGFVLVDAGGTRPAAERLIALLRRIDPAKPVKAIILTHWHGDHVLGLRRLLAEWPDARTISTTGTQRALNDPATMSYVPTDDEAATERMLAEMRQGADSFRQRGADPTRPADVREGFTRAARVMRQHALDLAAGSTRMTTAESFTDRLRIDDRAAPVEAMFLGRANTDGDAVIWLPRQRVLIAGDVVVSPMPYGFSSYPREWLDVLRRLKAFDFRLLVPGHGRPMRDAAYLDRLSALIAEVRAQVALLAAQDVPADQLAQRVDLTAQRRIFAGEDRWRGTIFDYYWTQPILRSAWREARGQPIRQGDHPE